MGVFTDLHNRLEVLRVANQVATLVNDRMDTINEDSANNYPLLLYRVIRESTTKYGINQDNPTLEIEFYLSDLWYQSSTSTLAEKSDAMVEQLDAVIKAIPDRDNNTFRLLNTSTAEYAWEQMNDNLFIVKRTASIHASRLNC